MIDEMNTRIVELMTQLTERGKSIAEMEQRHVQMTSNQLQLEQLLNSVSET